MHRLHLSDALRPGGFDISKDVSDLLIAQTVAKSRNAAGKTRHATGFHRCFTTLFGVAKQRRIPVVPGMAGLVMQRRKYCAILIWGAPIGLPFQFIAVARDAELGIEHRALLNIGRGGLACVPEGASQATAAPVTTIPTKANAKIVPVFIASSPFMFVHQIGRNSRPVGLSQETCPVKHDLAHGLAKGVPFGRDAGVQVVGQAGYVPSLVCQSQVIDGWCFSPPGSASLPRKCSVSDRDSDFRSSIRDAYQRPVEPEADIH